MVNRKRNLETLNYRLEEQKLSTISDVVTKVMEVIHDPKSSAMELAKIFEVDQTLSANLLKVANSAYYNTTGMYVDNIRNAIVRVGYKKTQEIVISATVCELFQDETLIGDFSRRELWKSSMGVAIANRMIYTDVFKSDVGFPFLAGLLHNIGIVFLDQFFHHNGFRDAVSNREKNQTILIQEEKKYIGITHEEVGEKIAEEWKFSNELKYIIANHHTMEKADKELEKLVNVTRLSELMCFSLEIGYSDFSEGDKEEISSIQENLEISDASLSFLLNSLNEEVEKLKHAGWFFNNG